MYGQYHTNYQKVVDFMTKMRQPVGVGFHWDDNLLYETRYALIKEEFKELEEALDEFFNKNGEPTEAKAQILKEAADLLYVVYGLFATLGISADEVFREVHFSNLSKLDDKGRPIYAPNGKVLKGPNYQPPDITQFVKD